jgi:hypothetical protein
MKNANRILLIIENIKELDILESNLTQNVFQIVKSLNLKEALVKVKEANPHLIVVNTKDTEEDIELFSKEVKMKYVKKTVLPSRLALEDYISIQTLEHLVIRGLARSKKYRDKKAIFFISQKNLN